MSHKTNTLQTKRLLIIVLTFLVIIVCMLFVSLFKMGDEASVGVFSLAATLVGTIFIAIELRNSQEVSCCEQLVDLNNYFHDNDRLMEVYGVLEKSYMAKDYSSKLFAGISDTDMACYCTFFENLYLLNHHKIAKISDLDDLFGYRFFLMTNNPYIQEHFLLPTSSSYTQIFLLYTSWKKYRDDENDNEDGTQRLMVGHEYAFSDEYLSRRLYLHDRGVVSPASLKTVESKGRVFNIRALGFEQVASVLALQSAAYADIEDKKWFFPLSRKELVESLHLDIVLGAFAEDGSLAAFAVIVNPREGSRSLSSDAGVQAKDALTFDAVAVSPSCRGFGLQRAFLAYADELAFSGGILYILATVAPDNVFSMHNFTADGYRINGENLSKYDGLTRNLLVKTVAQ